jgi:RNA polymerase sigma-70 factor (ECF subfamily)
LTGNRDDGDDLLQDALVKALLNFDRLRRPDAFRCWLYRIIVNDFKNRVKQPWWKRWRPLTPVIADTSPGENPIARHAARQRLDIAFKAISPEDKALITLFEMDGWSINELANLSGASAGAVRVRLSRARNKMRKALVTHLNHSGSHTLITPMAGEEKVCVVQKPVKD